MPKFEVKGLYYITHIDNLRSIVERGVLAHAVVERDGVQFTPIYDAKIVSLRKDKNTPNGESLWNFANFYFQPRNPMMYRVVHEKDREDLAVVCVNPAIIGGSGVLITNGNAASQRTQFFASGDGMDVIREQWSTIQSEWWNELNGSKRKIMAECLVPGHVGPEMINTIYVCSAEAQTRAKSQMGNARIPIVPEANMFFRPVQRIKIGQNISLIDGDMFFSGMHTLTVSVNLQGIMGKGLASRAKYQFPDVYVHYQDACRSRRIGPTKPCLYKREASMDEELADLTTPLNTPNAVKWFLLFATKRRWREDSRLEDIEGGLKWLRENIAQEGIRSLAIPALGCGLGNLKWSDVGPLMCRELHGVGIDVGIYLPREHKIPPESLTEGFLLDKTR